MILFGKSASKMEVMAAEFLPYEKQLYILVGDADKNIHVLQYDPESGLILSSLLNLLTKPQIPNRSLAVDLFTAAPYTVGTSPSASTSSQALCRMWILP